MKKFISESKAFNFKYPDDWEYFWQDDETILLHKKNSKDPVLRITPYNVNNPETFSPLEFIHQKQAEIKKGSLLSTKILSSEIKSDKMFCGIFSYGTAEENGVTLFVAHWILANQKMVFNFTFTTNNYTENDLLTASKIVASVKLSGNQS